METQAGSQSLQAENEALKRRIQELETKLEKLESQQSPLYTSANLPHLAPLDQSRRLNNDEIFRYGRQLILSEFGIEAQQKLAAASVLLVGAGGLGSPCALYLAGMGVGRLGLVDYDTVEVHNLHRQIAHSELSEGVHKALSAKKTINRFNSQVEVVAYDAMLSRTNAKEIFQPYDIVVDCSDNAVTRYLINDACVLLKKPLVSGAALRVEGQLTVYNFGPDCPCYRCLFPKPPPKDAQVPGIIGCLQALEVVKIAANIGTTLAQKLLLFDGLHATFRTVKLRPRVKTCAVCGDEPTITELIDYEQFCDARPDDKPVAVDILSPHMNIKAAEYQEKVIKQDKPHILLDVRAPVQYAICSLENSSNVPLTDMEAKKDVLLERIADLPVYVVCRRGIDSQTAAQKLAGWGCKQVYNIVGGLEKWKQDVDPSFPKY